MELFEMTNLEILDAIETEKRIRSGRFQSINFTEGLTSEAIEEKIAVLEAEIIINQEEKGI